MSDSAPWRNEMTALLASAGFAALLDESWDAPDGPPPPLGVALVDLAVSDRPAVAVLAALRSRTSIPILAVAPETYREPSVVDAYAAGVDQLVTRSVPPRELLARIRALVRRSPQEAPAAEVLVAHDVGISLDLATGVATIAGTDVGLTAAESAVLAALLARRGRVVTRTQLSGVDRGRPADSTLDSVVRSVRSKLEVAEGRRRIVAVRGVGFRLLHDWELDA